MKRFAVVAALAALLLVAAAKDSKKEEEEEESEELDYELALEYTFRFYEAQRAGILPRENRIPWRGDSFLLDKLAGQDLVGGYFDGSDFRKITHSLAFTMSVVGWSLLEFEQGFARAGQLQQAQDMLKWGMDWLLKAHYEKKQLVIQVGDSTQELQWWGRPEDSFLDRPVYLIDSDSEGADVAASVVAAMAIGQLVFENEDRDFYAELRESAKEIYDEMVRDKSGIGHETLPEGERAYGSYPSISSSDDKLWASLWMYRATMDEEYLVDANEYIEGAKEEGGQRLVWDWDNQFWACMVLMQKMGRASDRLDGLVRGYFTAWTGGSQKYGVKVNAEGFSYYNKAAMNRTNGNSAATALLAMLAAPEAGMLSGEKYRCFAQDTVNYLLGANGHSYSYMVGFGDEFPRKVIHRAAACPDAAGDCDWTTVASGGDNPHVLVGALVAGNGRSDGHDDSRSNWEGNAVSLDMNAGITGALAALAMPEHRCGADNDDDREYRFAG